MIHQKLVLRPTVAAVLLLVLTTIAVADPPPRPLPVEQPAPEKIDKAIDRGVAFLIERQNPDGSWGSARNTKGLNIFAPVPGAHHAFRTATTSLCISAMIEVGDDGEKGTAALDRSEAWLIENLPRLRRATPTALYNSWGHAYSIGALVRMYDRRPDDKERRQRIVELIEGQIDMLRRYECVDGGWCYYDFNAHTQRPSGSSISFVTAAVLVSLDEARGIGVEVPDRLVRRGIASILRQRKGDFTYCYGEYLKYQPARGINRPGGSLGRSQACNVALRLWDDEAITDDVLNVWLDRLFARNLWLDMGRKRPVPHESWFAVAGYFFYFGHYYAAHCIDQLPSDERAAHQDQLAQILLRLQEKDGCWWDYPLYDYHQPYGTAYALMSLARCRR